MFSLKVRRSCSTCDTRHVAVKRHKHFVQFTNIYLFLAKCPKGKPLPNVFCGRGPTRQHCPQGYSCNVEPTDGFAVCCPDDNSASKYVQYTVTL